jgi:RNA 2'-O ribose methyltransferase substrate binding
MTTLLRRSNPKIKQIHHLLSQRKQRDSSGLFVVEGIRHVGEAFAAHASVEYICYAPDLLTSDFAHQLIHEQAQLGIPCFAVDGDTFTGVAGKDNPQGIIAVVHQPHLQLDTLFPETFPWGVALVGPHKTPVISAQSCAPSMQWVPAACCCWMTRRTINTAPTRTIPAQCVPVWDRFFGTRWFPRLLTDLFNGHAHGPIISMALLPMRPKIIARSNVLSSP